MSPIFRSERAWLHNESRQLQRIMMQKLPNGRIRLV